MKVIRYTETDIEVMHIGLLSIEEYEAARAHIPSIRSWWWLRSPGLNSCAAACVRSGDGGVDNIGDLVSRDYVAVRPALHFNPGLCELQIDERFKAGGKPWTVIGEGLALCDEAFCKMPFRKDCDAENANSYEASDIKSYLDRWLKETR